MKNTVCKIPFLLWSRRRATAGLLLSVWGASVWAQLPLRDPMQMSAALAQMLLPKPAPVAVPAAVSVAQASEEADSGPARPQRLQLVMQRGDQAYALIDGQRVKSGDRVGGWTLSEIHASAVDLQWKDQTLRLSMFAALGPADAKGAHE